VCSTLLLRQQSAAPSTSAIAAVAAAQQHSSAGAGGGAGAKKRLGEAVGWFKGLGAAATSMVGSAGSGRAADAAEDPEYIKV
jgi:hypothetical protein